MEMKQFKLTSGEEIIGQVIEWPEEDNLEIIAKNMMKIQPVMGADGSVYYTLRPFLTSQISSDNLILVNMSQIVAEANPSDEVVNQYKKVIQSFLEEVQIEDEEEISIEDMMLRMVTPGDQIH